MAPAESGAPPARPAAHTPVVPAAEAASGSEAAPVATPQPTPLANRLAASPPSSPAPVQSPVAACQPGESFTQLVRALGESTLGRCLENEYVNLTTGDTHQRTTRGLLVWVKVRGVPAFTDGATTWYGCADAVLERPSGQPFPC